MKKYLLIFIFIFWVHSAHAAIALVTQVASTTGNPAQVGSFVITTPTAGDTLILGVAIGHAGNTSIASVTGGGVTWTRIAGTSVNRAAEVWCGQNATGVNSNVVVTQDLADREMWVNISEWSGMPKTGGCAESIYRLANTPSANPSTATITNKNANDLIYAMVRTSGILTLNSATNSFINMSNNSYTAAATAYLLPNAIVSTSTAWTATSGSWDTIILAIPPAPIAPTILTPTFIIKGVLMKIKGALLKILN